MYVNYDHKFIVINKNNSIDALAAYRHSQSIDVCRQHFPNPYKCID